MRSARITYGVLTVGAGLWCTLLFAPSLLAAAGVDSPAFDEGVYRFFRPICHQMDGRSWHLFGHAAAVCHRCSSIYLGFFVGTLLYPVFRRIARPVMPGRALVVAAAVPMVIDVAAAILGVYSGSTLWRVITGGWFGVLIPFLILPGAIEGVHQLLLQKAVPPPPVMKGSTDA
jgi:uncharacterized membrane protein